MSAKSECAFASQTREAFLSEIQLSPAARKRRDPPTAADIPALMQRFSLSAKERAVVEGTGLATIWARIKANEYTTYLDGGSRRILTSSILERRDRLIKS
jgi:hypothetical protein